MEVSSAGPQGAGTLWRAVGALLFVVLGFACAVMIVAMVDIGGTPTCHDVQIGNATLPADGQCFGGSATQKTISLVLGYPSGVLAGVTAMLALLFAITGRRGRLVLLLAGGAIVLGTLSIVIGSL